MKKGYKIIKSHYLDLCWHNFKDWGALYSYLIQNALYDDDYRTVFNSYKGKKQVVPVSRGQFYVKYNELADVLGYTDEQLRYKMRKLKDKGFIKIDSGRGYTIVSVLNYDKITSTREDSHASEIIEDDMVKKIIEKIELEPRLEDI